MVIPTPTVGDPSIEQRARFSKSRASMWGRGSSGGWPAGRLHGSRRSRELRFSVLHEATPTSARSRGGWIQIGHVDLLLQMGLVQSTGRPSMPPPLLSGREKKPWLRVSPCIASGRTKVLRDGGAQQLHLALVALLRVPHPVAAAAGGDQHVEEAVRSLLERELVHGVALVPAHHARVRRVPVAHRGQRRSLGLERQEVGQGRLPL